MESQKRDQLAKAEMDYKNALASKESSLAEKSFKALSKVKSDYAKALVAQKSALESQKQQSLAQAEEEYQKALESKQASQMVAKQAALAKAKREHNQALAAQKQALDSQKRNELAKVQQAYKDSLANKEQKLAAQTKSALAKARSDFSKKLAEQQQAAKGEKEQALTKAQSDFNKALHEQNASQIAKSQEALAKAQAAFAGALGQNESRLRGEKDRALADAGDKFAKALGKEKANSGKLQGQLSKFMKAQAAKDKIVTQLKDNFSNFDSNAVEVDSKTGKVKLHFQQSYFKRGRGELTDEMKAILRVMIPNYAKSIYGNKDAAKQVGSLNITGLTSPVYKGRYIDINDGSEETEKARKFNIKLSNERALAMFNFIFNDPTMSKFPYREKLKKDMGISAKGFLNSKPVPKELIGKKARCVKYDCSQEQAAVLQFQMKLE